MKDYRDVGTCPTCKTKFRLLVEYPEPVTKARMAVYWCAECGTVRCFSEHEFMPTFYRPSVSDGFVEEEKNV